jgi:hypothetical protein
MKQRDCEAEARDHVEHTVSHGTEVPVDMEKGASVDDLT